MEAAALPLDGVVLDSKYRLAEMIGQGGMGSVYRAQHVGTQRPVAIKVLQSRLVANAEAIERFRREARAAGRLRHPNVVDVTDFGIARVGDRDIAYIAMEYLEGTTLRELIDERGALPVDVVLEIVEQIAAALDVAHAAGIVHRDLKPDNVWLVHDVRGGYTVRVLDFGIALSGPGEAADPGEVVAVAPAEGMALAEPLVQAGEDVDSTRFYPAHGNSRTYSSLDPARANDSDSARLTTAGAMVGTPHYMSPEQCRGEAVDASSDVYSLGVLAWEALAGRRPFQGQLQRVLDGHLHDAPPPLPRGLDRLSAVLTRAMAKAPQARFDSARALAGSLRVAGEGPGVVLRRSLALYAHRMSEMSAVAWRCGRLPAVVAAVMLPLIYAAVAHWGLQLETDSRIVVLASLCSAAGWVWVTMFTNATFGLAIERLRMRPLERLEPGALALELRDRLGLPAGAGELRTGLKLLLYYVRCEATSRAGAGDLAFLIGLLERKSVAEIPPRCAQLFAASRDTYRRVAGSILAAMVLVPLFEASVFAHLFAVFGSPGQVFAILLAVSLMPINAIVLNPIFSCALALLYYRACQALGEDMPMAAVIPSRL
jgi:serine/threonine protein kinase